MPQEPISSPTVCPHLARYRPEGRTHTYDLCEAPGCCPFCPSSQELARLCHGEFTHCERFLTSHAAREAPQRAA